ncbi:YqaA family protein [Aurantimonas endophytica]|uniref:Membrane protein YqaA with SNARE-associated domain n=1 Tax=Aurantimonas endophytica TaxID=1522175 RepID=A0A7W6HC31_9HYPH|nr:YqaA family protein [Aurantimonas endophytica]MBB4002203.1 membrane protein YqaA with SNARE-associated domain [Aurantimonas endophytica]MCO6402168.1 DedA family protein [Aurantimonas endophytica]
MGDPGLYGGLVLASFLAATLLPGSSEALLSGLLAQGYGEPTLLVAAASFGNVTGSLANWLCGRFLARFMGRRWFPVSEKAYGQAASWFERYGLWTLLFAWVPIIGDPLTVVAGALRTPLVPFLALVTVGKVLRYAGVAAATLWWTGG